MVHCGTQEVEVEVSVEGATQGILRLGTAVQMSYTRKVKVSFDLCS